MAWAVLTPETAPPRAFPNLWSLSKTAESASAAREKHSRTAVTLNVPDPMSLPCSCGSSTERRYLGLSGSTHDAGFGRTPPLETLTA